MKFEKDSDADFYFPFSSSFQEKEADDEVEQLLKKYGIELLLNFVQENVTSLKEEDYQNFVEYFNGWKPLNRSKKQSQPKPQADPQSLQSAPQSEPESKENQSEMELLSSSSFSSSTTNTGTVMAINSSNYARLEDFKLTDAHLDAYLHGEEFMEKKVELVNMAMFLTTFLPSSPLSLSSKTSSSFASTSASAPVSATFTLTK